MLKGSLSLIYITLIPQHGIKIDLCELDRYKNVEWFWKVKYWRAKSQKKKEGERDRKKKNEIEAKSKIQVIVD